jgi:hypothetical protein
MIEFIFMFVVKKIFTEQDSIKGYRIFILYQCNKIEYTISLSQLLIKHENKSSSRMASRQTFRN